MNNNNNESSTIVRGNKSNHNINYKIISNDHNDHNSNNSNL